MTHLKYLLPNYERGDRYLRKICQRAHRFTHPFRLCNDPAEPGMKLTYGYLGNIARHARRCQQHTGLKPYRNIIIVDHGFGPEDLKNNIYRLMVHDNHVRGIQFSTENLLSARQQNAILQHLKSLQEDKSLRLMGNFSRPEKTKGIGLLVEHAPVLSALQTTKSFNPDEYKKKFQQRLHEKSLQLVRSFKRLEIDLTHDGERKKTINHGQQVTLKADQIQLAACPTSMMAISLILKGIAVELSPIHPLVDQLGTKISALNKKDALEVAYDAITKTTLGIQKIRELETALSQFNPERDIQNSAVIMQSQ